MANAQARSTEGFVPAVTGTLREGLTAADAVWVATALLHREHPECDQSGFLIGEIIDRTVRERLARAGVGKRTIYQHVSQHCVANRKPDPNNYRMLLAMGAYRRLWRPGDESHPEREGARSKPSNLPPKYADLLRWYETWAERYSLEAGDPLLALVGSGTHIWASEHADEYVNRLREGWK